MTAQNLKSVPGLMFLLGNMGNSIGCKGKFLFPALGNAGEREEQAPLKFKRFPAIRG